MTHIKTIEKILVSPEDTLLEAITRIDTGALQIALAVDANGGLLGTVTDGDIRRGLLRKLPLDTPVREVMNSAPVTLPDNTERNIALALMREKGIHCIPLVDTNGRITGIETEHTLIFEGERETCVVLMAGGLGMRLRPLTETLPKPMLEVQGKPMLEHIIERFRAQGFRRFYLCVNYKSEIIEEYFGDGAALECDIRYVHEDKPLGTGGALALLPGKDLSKDIIVMNGDLLTTVNFRNILSFHREMHSRASMCVIPHMVDIPFGVVKLADNKFDGIEEKPSYSFFVNTGIYVLNANLIEQIPANVFFDLPTLFNTLKDQDEKVSVLPLHEQWRDIGNMDDFNKIQDEVRKRS